MTTMLGEPPSAGSVPWTPRSEAERILDGYVSPVVGIVRRLYERMRDVDDLQAYSTGGEACDSRVLLGTRCNKANGGCGVTPEEARLGAIGETVERYSGAWVPFEQLEHGTYRELSERGAHCLAPAEFTPFAEWQYDQPNSPFVRFTPDTALQWTKSRRLADGTARWIPAQLAYLRADIGPDEPIAYPTSNGLAYGCTPDEALVGAVLELVERDGVMLTWYKELSLPLIDIESDPELAAFFRKHVWPSRVRVSLIDLHRFTGLPAVLAVARNRWSELAPLGLGGAAAATPLRAAVKAACEAVSVRSWAMIKQREGHVLDPEGDLDETVRTFDDHIALYANAAMVPRTEFLDASAERVSLADIPSLPDSDPGTLREALISTLTAQGIDLFGLDATSPDVQEGGGAVVRVFSPQLQPLDCGYQRRFLGGRRLRERPAALDLLSPEQAEHLNPLPHPFP